jgi:hypothetical protein
MVYLPPPQTGTLGLLLELCPVVPGEKDQWNMLIGILLGFRMHVGHLHLFEKVCMHLHYHAFYHNW